MARKKHHVKELQWREIVRRQPRSGLSIRKFRATQQVSEASFHGCRRRLRDREIDESPTWAVARGRDEMKERGEFIPLKLLDAASTWEVVDPLGYRVRVSGEVSAPALQCILRVLDGRARG